MDLFNQCPKTWYYKYVLKIPGKDDLTYAFRGNVVHHCLELYYSDKNVPLEQVRQLFETEWTKYKLDKGKLAPYKNQSWQMVVNGVNLNLDCTSTELKMFYPDTVGYIDLVDSNNNILYDWKTSTRSEHNEESYAMQLKYYGWLYYRKFDIVPKECTVVYLKYSDDKMLFPVTITMDSIKEAEQWQQETLDKMNFYINNPEKLPGFNKEYFFSPYKHLWDTDIEPPETMCHYILEIRGDYVFVKGDINNFLHNHIDKKFSYELKNAYHMKNKNPNANTVVNFWSRTYKRLPTGFLDELIKTLNDYAVYNKKTPNIEIVDKRKTFGAKDDNMPDKLLTKELYEYQLEAVNKFFSGGNTYKILELSTGAGKTLIASEIVRRLNTTTLFVVDKRDLLYQTKEVFVKELGIDIGIIGDGKSDIKNVTVATVQTLNKNLNKYKDYLETVEFAIFDECHHAAAKSYYKLSRYLVNTKHRLGCSATAFRDDGNDMMMTAVVGYNKFSITGQDLIDNGYLMKPMIKFVRYEMDKKQIEHKEQTLDKKLILQSLESGKSITVQSTFVDENDIPLAIANYLDYYKEFIVNNDARNNEIKHIVNNNKDKTILILVKHVEHGKMLNSMMPDSVHTYGDTIVKLRDSALEDFKNGKIKVLISTISIFAEGVNIPSLNIIINAAANRGDGKTLQVLGRVMRTCEGKSSAEYYDFYDTYKFFGNSARARVNTLREQGHTVVIK